MLEKLNEEWFTILVVLLGFVGTWTTLRNDSKWHTEWIKKHSSESDARELVNSNILTELRISNAHITTLLTSHDTDIQLLRRQWREVTSISKGPSA